MDELFQVSCDAEEQHLHVHWLFPPGNPKDSNAWLALYNVAPWQASISARRALMLCPETARASKATKEPASARVSVHLP